MVPKKKSHTSKDSLTDIKGVGQARAKKIKKAGFATPQALASASASSLEEAGFSKSMAKKLVSSAKKHVGKASSQKKSVRVTQESKPIRAPSRPMSWGRVAIAVLVVLLVATGAWFAASASSESPVEDSEPVASVNGEVISQAELASQYASLPAELRQQYSEEDVLVQLVDKELIMQYAAQQGIVVTQADAEARIDEQTQEMGVDREQLRGMLAGNNVSFDQYVEAIREEMVLEALLDAIMADIEVTDEEVALSYEQLPAEEREQVSEAEVREALEMQVASESFSSLIGQLREQADIQYFGPYTHLAAE